MSFSSKPKALATLGVYRKLVHIPKVYHKKEVVRNCEKQIKKGVLMINASRGEIIDTNALIEGIENGIICGAGIDSFENEQEVIHIDHNYNVIKNRDLLILKAYPNAIVTPHAAFYMNQVSYDMVYCSLESLKE
ncbi:NAD(P)-dependent oxidoreductase [Holdemanella biformis]|uniref:NAD(P)-dependent oxidoreductase n=1 Tax=Holdemanella biformis TaxID=1735 RepID=UPI00265FD322|nr:NAD(P)-dependent oxidoreductase [Holdemanella biformis]